ncbi:MAG: hypothetical protein U0900_17450 [Myxococcota bacterium]
MPGRRQARRKDLPRHRRRGAPLARHAARRPSRHPRPAGDGRAAPRDPPGDEADPVHRVAAQGLRRDDRARDRDRHPRRRGGVVARRRPTAQSRQVEEPRSRFEGATSSRSRPMYSAVKKDGVPLHRLARQGIDVEREPKWITIDALELTR